MDLSIVIVNWNTKDLLRDCLASVQRSLDGIDAEVLVIDNASTDGSAEMVMADFANVWLIANPENRGFAAANTAARAFNVATIPALAILTVCCSITS